MTSLSSYLRLLGCSYLKFWNEYSYKMNQKNLKCIFTVWVTVAPPNVICMSVCLSPPSLVLCMFVCVCVYTLLQLVSRLPGLDFDETWWKSWKLNLIDCKTISLKRYSVMTSFVSLIFLSFLPFYFQRDIILILNNW